MKLKILTSVTIALLTASVANAADLGRKPTAPTFSAQPVATWTGFYVGVNGGYGQDNLDVKNSTDKERTKGGLIGGTIGYNHEFANRIVLGVEGDLAISMLSKKSNTSTAVPGGNQVETFTINNPLFATARARLGYSMGSWMPYVTAGLAYTSTTIKNSDQFVPTVGAAGPISRDKADSSSTGFALGAGVEAMITSNISLKAEYIYADFSATKFDFKNNAGVVVGTAKISNKMNIGRVGLNYRF